MSSAWKYSVPERVARQAAARPADPALVSGDRIVSYGELSDEAARVRATVYCHRSHQDSVVGIFLPRSPQLVITALGVMGAGCAYLPLDPAHPAERIAAILTDAGVDIVLSDARRAGTVPPGPWQVITIDNLPADLPGESEIGSENLAYVLFTSGSTGKPKGVEITHGGLANLVSWHLNAFNVMPTDRASQVSSFSFDAAAWEVWPYLCAGASIHFTDDDTRVSPERLQAFIQKHEISIGFLPTFMAERVISLPWPRETSLRLLLTGGDALRSYPPDTLPFDLVNNYGPTECTVVATSGLVPRGSRRGAPSIGTPIDQATAYLLDENRQPVAAGDPGELYVGGAGVARGYRNSPELTQQRFIPDRFSAVPGARLYRTGDVCRRNDDGELEFIGRADDQVKVRGYRIEPGEIETVLSHHPDVQRAVVVAVGDGADSRLVAYVVPEGTPELTPDALGEYVLTQLPPYMVPSFVRVDSLPLNSSGKLDRAALPDPSAAEVSWSGKVQEPKTPTEKALAAIVGELLGLQRVGIGDNFFLLGGHSLLGAQLVARVRDAFGVELSLLAVFDAPTIEQLAAAIEALIFEQLESLSEDEIRSLLG